MTIPSKAIPEVSPSVNPLRRKKTYCCAGAAFLAAVSFVAAVNMNPYRLPDPEHADREGLFRWLVTRDLSQEGADLRRLLVARLERELDAGVDFETVETNLTDAQAALFWANVDVLMPEWLAMKSERFGSLAAEEQLAFVDQHIAKVQRWGLLQRMSARKNNASQQSNALAHAYDFATKAQAWVELLEPHRRAEARKLIAAVQMRMLLRAVLPTRGKAA